MSGTTLRRDVGELVASGWIANGVPTAAMGGNTVPGMPIAASARAEACNDGTALISY